MKTYKYLIVLALLLGSLFPAQTIFFDDFGANRDVWTFSSPAYTIANGEFTWMLDSQTGTIGSLDWKDIFVSVRLKITSYQGGDHEGWKTPSIKFYNQDNLSFYSVQIYPNGAIGIGGKEAGSPQGGVDVWADGLPALGSFGTNQWYKVSLAMTNTTLYVYVNDIFIQSHTYTEAYSPSGKVSIVFTGCMGSMDDVIVDTQPVDFKLWITNAAASFVQGDDIVISTRPGYIQSPANYGNIYVSNDTGPLTGWGVVADTNTRLRITNDFWPYLSNIYVTVDYLFEMSEYQFGENLLGYNETATFRLGPDFAVTEITPGPYSLIPGETNIITFRHPLNAGTINNIQVTRNASPLSTVIALDSANSISVWIDDAQYALGDKLSLQVGAGIATTYSALIAAGAAFVQPTNFSLDVINSFNAVSTTPVWGASSVDLQQRITITFNAAVNQTKAINTPGMIVVDDDLANPYMIKGIEDNNPYTLVFELTNTTPVFQEDAIVRVRFYNIEQYGHPSLTTTGEIQFKTRKGFTSSENPFTINRDTFPFPGRIINNDDNKTLVFQVASSFYYPDEYACTLLDSSGNVAAVAVDPEYNYGNPVIDLDIGDLSVGTYILTISCKYMGKSYKDSMMIVLVK